MSANKAQGDFRVLWLGDPRVLPGNGWELAPGLAYSRERERVCPTSPGCGRARHRARRPPSATASGSPAATPRSGWVGCSLPTRCATSWWWTPWRPRSRASRPRSPIPPRATCSARCRAQIDLRQIISQGGFDVFVDPSRAAPAGDADRVPAHRRHPASAVTGVDPRLTGWRPALLGAPGATSVDWPGGGGDRARRRARPPRAWQLTGPARRASCTATSVVRLRGAPSTWPDRGPSPSPFVGSWVHGLRDRCWRPPPGSWWRPRWRAGVVARLVVGTHSGRAVRTAPAARGDVAAASDVTEPFPGPTRCRQRRVGAEVSGPELSGPMHRGGDMTGSLRRALMIAVLVAILVLTGISDRIMLADHGAGRRPGGDVLSTLRVAPTREAPSLRRGSAPAGAVPKAAHPPPSCSPTRDAVPCTAR